MFVQFWVTITSVSGGHVFDPADGLGYLAKPQPSCFVSPAVLTPPSDVPLFVIQYGGEYETASNKFAPRIIAFRLELKR